MGPRGTKETDRRPHVRLESCSRFTPVALPRSSNPLPSLYASRITYHGFRVPPSPHLPLPALPLECFTGHVNETEKAGANPKPVSRVILGFGLWATIVVMFATQFVWLGALPWADAFVHASLFWALWVVFTPLVVWCSFRFPLERTRLAQNLSSHVAASVLIVLSSQFVFRTFDLRPPPPSRSDSSREEREEEPDRRDRKQVPNGFLGLRAGLDILVYWSLVSACQAIVHFRKSEQRERRAAELQARLTRSQLQSLRMQINPHFLFNTLNAISTLVHLNPKAADEMITDLSELLRKSLDSADEQEIPLGRELDFIRRYAGIEQRRFGDRLRVVENVPRDLESALVPALILQPLVENAIRHGIEPRKDAGVVTITATHAADGLHLTVADNGRGTNPEALKPRKGSRQGIGLANTQARLKELYGQNHSFLFGPGPNGGCEVHIRLPYHLDRVETEPKELSA